MRQFHTVDRSRKTLRPTHVVTVAVTQEAPPALRNGSQYCRNSENCLFGNPGDDDTPAASAPQTSASKSASKLRFRILNIFITMYERVFFSHRHFFSLPAAGRFSCSRLWGTQRARQNTTARIWALTEVRGTCSGGSKSQVTTGRHSEHIEPSRPMRTHVQVKKWPKAHVISTILNVVNVIRHYLVMVYRCGRTIGHLTVGDFTVTEVPLFCLRF